MAQVLLKCLMAIYIMVNGFKELRMEEVYIMIILPKHIIKENVAMEKNMVLVC